MVEQQIRNIDQEIGRCQTKLNDVKRKYSEEQDLVENIQMEIKELRSYDDVVIPDLDTLQSEVEECETKIEELTKSWKSLNADLMGSFVNPKMLQR